MYSENIIFHIDLDAFFASVEEAENPSLIDKPVIIGGNDNHGIVSTANYIARKYGVSSAMPMYIAKRKCPNAIILPVNMPLYEDYHNRFIKIIKEFCPMIEVASIDECYIDATNICKSSSAELLAKKIQIAVKKQLKLSCSIGISKNKFLAKMASDYKKPMGISSIFPSDLSEKIWPLDIGKMPMIGKTTELELKKNGITTIGMLSHASSTVLEKVFGKRWAMPYFNANGHGEDNILPTETHDFKSLSIGMTFPNPINEYEKNISILYCFLQKLLERLEENNLYFKTLTVSIKTSNSIVISHSISIEKTNNLEEIFFKLRTLYEEKFNNIYAKTITLFAKNIIKKRSSFF